MQRSPEPQTNTNSAKPPPWETESDEARAIDEDALDEAAGEKPAGFSWSIMHGAEEWTRDPHEIAKLSDPPTLDSLPIPRVVIAAKKKIAYRLADLAAFIERNLEH